MSLLFVALTGTSPSMGGGGGGGGLATAATGALLFGELPPVAFDIGFHLQVVVILLCDLNSIVHALYLHPACSHRATRVAVSGQLHPSKLYYTLPRAG